MRQYTVDAFSKEIFKGNPAAVCILDEFMEDELLLSITKENNLSETAFAVKVNEGHYNLRWFTPGGEVDLCGHATLATAFILNNYYEKGIKKIVFDTLSGELIVKVKDSGLYEMEFPSYDLKQIPVNEDMKEALGVLPIEAYIGRDLVCVLRDEEQVHSLKLNMNKIAKLDGLLVHATAKGKAYDCVSRSFAPKLSVNEDPVCGSGHCHIIPYWSNNLNKKSIVAYQASERTGILYCSFEGGKTKLSGYATLFSISEINIY